MNFHLPLSANILSMQSSYKVLVPMFLSSVTKFCSKFSSDTATTSVSLCQCVIVNSTKLAIMACKLNKVQLQGHDS